MEETPCAPRLPLLRIDVARTQLGHSRGHVPRALAERQPLFPRFCLRRLEEGATMRVTGGRACAEPAWTLLGSGTSYLWPGEQELTKAFFFPSSLHCRKPKHRRCPASTSSSMRDSGGRRAFGVSSSRVAEQGSPWRQDATARGDRGVEGWARGSGASSEQTHEFFATCQPGLEAVVARELQGPCIGAHSVVPGRAGVAFAGTMATGYRANLWLRAAIRVLLRMASAPLDSRLPAGDSIYAFVREAVPWGRFLADPREKSLGTASFHALPKSPSPRGACDGASSAADGVEPQSSPLHFSHRHVQHCQTFSVESRVWDCSNVSSALLANVRAKDAVCDALRSAYGGAKPLPPARGSAADLPLFLTVFRDHATLFRDMSGQSLHKRGYRSAMHRASLNEAVAAAVLLLAGWDKVAQLPQAPAPGEEGGAQAPLVLLDPMCGSGTFLIEAALLATRTAPGLLRTSWPFQTWLDFDEQAWQRCMQAAWAQQQPCPAGVRILGNDIHEGALALCDRDAEAAGVRDLIQVHLGDCKDFVPPATPALVVVNPPWGSRLNATHGEEARWLEDTWYGLGQFLRNECANSEVFVVSGNSSVTQKLFMRSSDKWPVTVGGIDCRILRYHVRPQARRDGAPRSSQPQEHAI